MRAVMHASGMPQPVKLAFPPRLARRRALDERDLGALFGAASGS